jgi:Zn-dependent protease
LYMILLLVFEILSMGAMCDFISIVVYSAAVLSVQETHMC